MLTLDCQLGGLQASPASGAVPQNAENNTFHNGRTLLQKFPVVVYL